jgi:hypothetical protein
VKKGDYNTDHVNSDNETKRSGEHFTTHEMDLSAGEFLILGFPYFKKRDIDLTTHEIKNYGDKNNRTYARRGGGTKSTENEEIMNLFNK